MKNLSLFALIIFCFATACESDDVSDLATVTSPITLSETFDLATETQTTFNVVEIFDVNNDNEVQKFGANIDDFEVDSITFEFDNYVGADEIILNSAQIKILDNANVQISSGGFPTNLSLKGLDDSNAVVSFYPPSDVAQEIAAILKDSGIIKIQFEGEVSDAPASATGFAKIYIKVTGALL